MTFYLKKKRKIKTKNTRRNNLQRKILHKNKNWLDRTCCVTWCRQMTCIQRAHSLIAHLFQRNDFSNSFLISIPTDYILSSSNAGFAFDCMFRDGHRYGCQCPHGEHSEHRKKTKNHLKGIPIWRNYQSNTCHFATPANIMSYLFFRPMEFLLLFKPFIECFQIDFIFFILLVLISGQFYRKIFETKLELGLKMAFRFCFIHL